MNPTAQKASDAIDAARKLITDLCKMPSQPGARAWLLSIPMRPRDPDVVFGLVCDIAEQALIEIQILEARVHANAATINELERRIAQMGARLEGGG